MNKQELLTLARGLLPQRYPQLVADHRSDGQLLGLFNRKLLSDDDFQATVLLGIAAEVAGQQQISTDQAGQPSAALHQLQPRDTAAANVVSLGFGSLKAAASAGLPLINIDWHNAATDQWYHNSLTFIERRGRLFAQLELAQGMLTRLKALQASSLQIIAIPAASEPAPEPAAQAQQPERKSKQVLVEYKQAQLTQTTLTAPWLGTVTPEAFFAADNCVELKMKRS